MHGSWEGVNVGCICEDCDDSVQSTKLGDGTSQDQKVFPPPHHHHQAGLLEEMMEDTFEGLEDDDVEEAADAEVEKILWEVTSGEYRFRALDVDAY